MQKRLQTLVWYMYGSLVAIGFLLSCSQAKVPLADTYEQLGVASWYGEPFHGRQTANGEVYDMFQLTAAHKFAPLGIEAIVTNLANGRSVRVRINDRGPYIDDRVLDLSYAAAQHLGMVESGLTQVRIRFLPETVPAPLFVVQAGAYLYRDNAEQVLQALTADYPKAWVAAVQEGDRVLYRVWLGSFTRRSTAEDAVRNVQARGYMAYVFTVTPASTQTANRL